MFDIALFINHYCDAALIHLTLGKLNSEKVLVVSTHHLFKHEKEEITIRLEAKEIQFIKFDTWNKDLDKLNLDLEAYNNTKKRLKYTSIYHTSYFNQIAYSKNQFIHQQLLVTNCISDNTQIIVFCQTYDIYNLGISHTYWKQNGATIINCGPFSQSHLLRKRITSTLFFRVISFHLKAFLLAFKPVKATMVKDDCSYYLLSTLRIKIKPELVAGSRWVIPFIRQFREGFLAAPIHSSNNLLAMYPFVSRKNMAIIQDAFRPTSYPPYYYACSYKDCKIIPSNRVDYTLFESAHLAPYSYHNFLVPKPLLAKQNSSISQVNTICLSLNHSGPWSTLISRCDTDYLIDVFADLAAKYSSKTFIIRLHPNSDDMLAEGNNWKKRIKNFLKNRQLNNLTLSEVNLEKDWERCDLFLTEYSLSAIDALQFGKLVLFLNLTKRRSFMIDFTKLGFTEVMTIPELHQEFEKFLTETVSVYTKLKKSAEKYNQLNLA